MATLTAPVYTAAPKATTDTQCRWFLAFREGDKYRIAFSVPSKASEPELWSAAAEVFGKSKPALVASGAVAALCDVSPTIIGTDEIRWKRVDHGQSANRVEFWAIICGIAYQVENRPNHRMPWLVFRGGFKVGEAQTYQRAQALAEKHANEESGRMTRASRP